MRWTAIGDRPDFALFFLAADRLGQSGPTLSPAASPIPRRDAGLSMAPEEEIYVREDLEGAESPTAFVGRPPAADEIPPVPDLGNPTLDPEPPPTADMGAAIDPAGAVDEVPPDMVGSTMGTPRYDQDSPTVDLHAEARSLGFDLGPDPDTQEQTMEATQASTADLADTFMATGNMPAQPQPPPVSMPPLPTIAGRVPVTVAPQSIAPRSVLDDDEPVPRSSPNVAIWGVFAAVMLALVVATGWLMWISDQRAAGAAAGPAPTTTAPAGEAAPPPAAQAGPPPEGAPPPSSATAEVAAADAEVARAAAEAKAAQDAALSAAAAEAAARAEQERKAQAEARATAEKHRQAAASAKVATPEAAAPRPRGGSAKSLADAGWKAIDGGKVEEAHGLFARALQADPGYGWALYGRGYANEKLGDTVSARADFCSALGRDPADAELVRELNGGLRRLGQSCP